MFARDIENPQTAWDMEGLIVTESAAIAARAEIPAEAWKIYLENLYERVPSSFAYHKSTGWCVISSCGQGPIFDYREKPEINS